MPRQSALRNIPLLSQRAYDAAKNRLELWQDAASERLETWVPRKWVANFFVHLSGSWGMTQITDHAWKDTITQIVEEDSAACERDGLDVVPAGPMTNSEAAGVLRHGDSPSLYRSKHGITNRGVRSSNLFGHANDFKELSLISG